MKRVCDRKEECFGCSACVEACPLGIITMQRDEEGFPYASFDEHKCVNCGKCKKACPDFDSLQDTYERSFYAFRSNDRDERMKSSSGAAFFMIAKTVLADGGVVVGAAFNEKYQVRHCIVETESELQMLRTSKYAQSDTTGVYGRIAAILEERKVLFCGTPCQCDAVRRYVIQKKAKIENLLICDLICGKIVSPKIWEEYLEYIEKHFNGRLTRFVFRDKKFGWQYHKCRVEIDGEDVSTKASRECNWMELYAHPSFCRPSCYICPFTRVERNTDMTIGDFWGIERFTDKYNDATGVNLLIVHSEKGEELLKITCESQSVQIEKAPREDCMQPKLLCPNKCPDRRNVFWDTYYNKGIEGTINAYCRRSLIKEFVYSKVVPTMRKHKIYDFSHSFLSGIFVKVFRRS